MLCPLLHHACVVDCLFKIGVFLSSVSWLTNLLRECEAHLTHVSLEYPGTNVGIPFVGGTTLDQTDFVNITQPCFNPKGTQISNFTQLANTKNCLERNVRMSLFFSEVSFRNEVSCAVWLYFVFSLKSQLVRPPGTGTRYFLASLQRLAKPSDLFFVGSPVTRDKNSFEHAKKTSRSLNPHFFLQGLIFREANLDIPTAGPSFLSSLITQLPFETSVYWLVCTDH